MQRFKAVLFDIDGTLLDTSEFIFQAFEHTLREYNLPPRKRSEMAALVGRPLEICYKVLTGIEDLQEIQELRLAHRRFQTEHMHLSKPYPEVRETLDILSSAGIKMAAVTTRTGVTVPKTLELAGISKYISYVVALEDVVNLKPHPEPVYKALDYLEAEPEDSAMVGDTDVDIQAGKNAGTATIGVTYGFHGASIAEANPDYIINHIEEILPILQFKESVKQ